MTSTDLKPRLSWENGDLSWIAYDDDGNERYSVSEEEGEFEAWAYQPRLRMSIGLTRAKNPPRFACLCAAKAACEAAYARKVAK